MAFAAPFVVEIALLILRKTGPWWIPMILGYIVLLQIPTAWWITRRDKVRYHAQVGDEVYYQVYPEDLKRALRKARKKRGSKEVNQTITFYRDRLVTAAQPFDELQEKNRRLRAALLYAGGGVLFVLGLFLIRYALPIPKGFLFPGTYLPDYTPIFLLVCALFSLITAAALFMQKPAWRIKMSASILFFLSFWSVMISVSKRSHYSVKDLIILTICLLIYAAAAFGLPALAGDIRTKEQICRDNEEYQLALYELGLIPEDELEFRLLKRGSYFTPE
ncbi:MAG: hypothetical protein II882_00555 [Lachnospiraceae bacterium]|nr:hypothetical protein [Lachnospiraceae bacterium]